MTTKGSSFSLCDSPDGAIKFKEKDSAELLGHLLENTNTSIEWFWYAEEIAVKPGSHGV